jgi:hypothetical protein
MIHRMRYRPETTRITRTQEPRTGRTLRDPLVPLFPNCAPRHPRVPQWNLRTTERPSRKGYTHTQTDRQTDTHTWNHGCSAFPATAPARDGSSIILLYPLSLPPFLGQFEQASFFHFHTWLHNIPTIFTLLHLFIISSLLPLCQPQTGAVLSSCPPFLFACLFFVVLGFELRTSH